MTEVYVATGTSSNKYHTYRHCYHLQKAEQILTKTLSHIQVHYQKCSECSKWDSK